MLETGLAGFFYMEYIWSYFINTPPVGWEISVSLCVLIRAVKISTLIYAINVAAINAIKYFNAVNATLFTSGVRCPLTRNRRVPTQRPRFTDDTELLLLSVTLLKSTRTCHTSCSSLWHSNNHPVFFTPLPPSPLTRRPTSQWEPVIPHSPTSLV